MPASSYGIFDRSHVHRVGCSRGPPKTEKRRFIVSQRARCDIVVAHSVLLYARKVPEKVRENRRKKFQMPFECLLHMREPGDCQASSIPTSKYYRTQRRFSKTIACLLALTVVLSKFLYIRCGEHLLPASQLSRQSNSAPPTISNIISYIDDRFNGNGGCHHNLILELPSICLHNRNSESMLVFDNLPFMTGTTS